MASRGSKGIVTELLAHAGIVIAGNNPWDLKVNDERVFDRVLKEGPLGLGEAYMEGWWDVERVDEFLYRIQRAPLGQYARRNWRFYLFALPHLLFNFQRRSKAKEVALVHYDRGNDLFKAMLDKRMAYSCGFWKDVSTLQEAQEAKLDLVCRKLSLEPGMKVLDMGCGFGSFAKFAAEKYGVTVVGVTNSEQQATLARKLCEGLSIEIRLQDYRDVSGTYDHIVSIAMFEAVGHNNFRTYMKIVHDHLNDNGLFLLHTIGGNFTRFSGDAWTEKYIFPNGMIPSIKQIGTAIEKLFVMEDWHSFGTDYDKTLMAWFHNFDAAWQDLKGKYGERFYRMWTYYLLSFASSFRARELLLWQIVLSKNGVPGGYTSVR